MSEASDPKGRRVENGKDAPVYVVKSDDTEINPSQMAEVSMRGVVQSMLDQQMSEDELEALTV